MRNIIVVILLQIELDVMATQMKFNTTDPMNYPEPDDEDAIFDAQQLVNGALKFDNYPPIQKLEKIKADSDRALQLTHFSTSNEKTMAESLQRNTNAWIDTAKDVLCVVIDVAGLVTTCGPAIKIGVLTSVDVDRATQHAISVGETLKRIYNRACDMAINNSNGVLLAIDYNEKTSQDSTVKTAAEQHRNDLKNFQEGKVNINVPHQSHAKLTESIKQAEQNEESDVRAKAERSSRAWDTAITLGVIVLAVGAIIGFVVLKR